MAQFMELKSNNRRLKRSEIAKILGMSSCTLQRYKHGKNTFSPYKIPSKTHKRR